MNEMDEGSLRSQASGEVRESVFNALWETFEVEGGRFAPGTAERLTDAVLAVVTPELERRDGIIDEFEALLTTAMEERNTLAWLHAEAVWQLAQLRNTLSLNAAFTNVEWFAQVQGKQDAASARPTAQEFDCKEDCPETEPECRCAEQAWHRTCCHVWPPPATSPEATSEASQEEAQP